MAKLKDVAEAYVPEQTLNISELDRISVDVETSEEEKVDKEGKPYTQTIVTIDGKKYRVPDSVLDGLKNLMKKMPQLKMFTVLKTGSGMGTKYQVLPAEEKVN